MRLLFGRYQIPFQSSMQVKSLTQPHKLPKSYYTVILHYVAVLSKSDKELMRLHRAPTNYQKDKIMMLRSSQVVINEMHGSLLRRNFAKLVTTLDLELQHQIAGLWLHHLGQSPVFGSWTLLNSQVLSTMTRASTGRGRIGSQSPAFCKYVAVCWPDRHTMFSEKTCLQ